MVILESFLRNPLEDDKISEANFRQMGFDHNSRMQSNNAGGLLTARAAATDIAFKQYDAVYGSKTVEEAIKKGATFGLRGYTTLALTETRQLEKLVALKFGNPSKVYLQFFPKGLTEFNNAGKGEWPQLLIRLKTATETHKIILDAATAKKFADLQTGYGTAEGDQVGSKGSVDDFRNLLAQKRQILAFEMFTNLLTICLLNIGNPAAIKTYFDQTIVDRKQSSDSDGFGRGLVSALTAAGEPVNDYLAEYYNEETGQLVNISKSKGNKLRTPNIPKGIYKVILKKAGLPDKVFIKEVFDDRDEETGVSWG